jgi:beta-glucosidase
MIDFRRVPMPLLFPVDFVWGAATSAHQVEGANVHSDWWHFEQHSGKVTNKSGYAVDHYNRFRDDFDLVQSFHHNAHRLSIEWARIEPREDEWDESECRHYEEVLTALRDRNIRPFVTLHHFSSPQWLAAQGGFSNDKAPDCFARFAERIARRLGSLVDTWTTFNEPTVAAFSGYWFGSFAPGLTDKKLGFRALRNKLVAHGKAFQALKSLDAHKPVGLVHTIDRKRPWRSWSAADRTEADFQDHIWNEAVFQALATGYIDLIEWPGEHVPGLGGSFDYWGINFYRDSYCTAEGRHVPPALEEEYQSHMAWGFTPEGLYDMLRRAARFGKPIYVTENGISTDDDRERIWYLAQHLAVIHRALREAVPVRGYFHWSLLDNYEWGSFAEHFGLVHIDPETLKRTPKPSARFYADLIKAGGLSTELLHRYLGNWSPIFGEKVGHDRPEAFPN